MRIISPFTDIYDHASGWYDPTIVFKRETQVVTVRYRDRTRLRDTLCRLTPSAFGHSLGLYWIMGRVFIDVEGELYCDQRLPKRDPNKKYEWWEKHFFSNVSVYSERFDWIHEEYGAPVIGCRVNRWKWEIVELELNPCIKDTGIGKYYSPFNMHQDIMQWVINRQEIKGKYDFDDRTIRDSKGFNNKSFKHRS